MVIEGLAKLHLVPLRAGVFSGKEGVAVFDKDEPWKTDRQIAATAALARLRVKVAQLDRAVVAEPSVLLDGVLALIDEEMRDV